MKSSPSTDRAQEEKKSLRMKSQELLRLVKEDEPRWIYKTYRVENTLQKHKVGLKPECEQAHQEYLQQVKELKRI